MVQAAESYLSEMQKVAGEDGLADAEIARLLKTVQAAQFKRSEVIPADADGSFKPRSLVEIAFEAEKKRQEDAARQLVMEKAAQLAAQQAEQQAEQAGENASENLPDNGAANQTVAQPEADSENPDMGSAANNPTAVQDAGAISQPALSQQQEAEQQQQKTFNGTARLRDCCITHRIEIGITHRNRKRAVLRKVEILTGERRKNRR